MIVESLSCPNCGAPLHQPKSGSFWVCVYCNSLIHLQANQPQPSLEASLDAAEMTGVKQLLISGQRAQAIQRFQQLSGLSGEQAEAAIDQMAAEFSMRTIFYQQLTPVGVLLVAISLVGLPASLVAWWSGWLSPWLALPGAALAGFGLFVYGRAALITLRYLNAPQAPATTLHFTHIGVAQVGQKRLHTFLIALEVKPESGASFQSKVIIPVREENITRVRQGHVIQVKYLPGKPDSVIFHRT